VLANARFEHLGARRWLVELDLEAMEEPGDLAGVLSACDARRAQPIEPTISS
jgi:hypothetical protein